MMNRKTFVVAMRPNSKLIKVAVTVLIAMTFALVSDFRHRICGQEEEGQVRPNRNLD